MHAVFMPYGRIEWVQFLLNDMRAQKCFLPCHRKNPTTGEEEKMNLLTECQVRQLPGGLIEFIFPKEYEAQVLSELGFDAPGNGHTDFNLEKEFSFGLIKIKPLKYLREWLRIEPTPKFVNTGITFGWYRFHVSIIPLGVRYEQGEIVEKENSPYAGWWHEAI